MRRNGKTYMDCKYCESLDGRILQQSLLGKFFRLEFMNLLNIRPLGIRGPNAHSTPGKFFRLEFQYSSSTHLCAQ